MPVTWWDVEPKKIRQTQSFDGVVVPVVIRGNPPAVPYLEIGDESIAEAHGSGLRIGNKIGATMVTVRAGPSVRYIQVEVIDETATGYQPGDDPHDPSTWGNG
ncbi:hypothetical protein SCOR_32835 [Sulfidibacter corallicola]|uniref:Uncharacterized protein n=1 Tax=Sulfidibacter corallicola TaxID=2818388 RepID=A0A8A4TJ97_SULCO|nr:hypothetical protein [Sulfidibacter corallicola]QTD49673.1 hypothetical protein J3U87_29165 [Sulfidibacter corallicola]